MSKRAILVELLSAIAIVWPWVKARFDAWLHRFISSRKRLPPMSEVVDEVQAVNDAAAQLVDDTAPAPVEAVAPQPAAIFPDENADIEPVADPLPLAADADVVDPLVEDDPQADAPAESDALVLDGHTAAILTAQVAKAGSDSKEAAMLQPTLATLAVASNTDIDTVLTGTISPTAAKPSIPLQVAFLEENAEALATALEALVTKLAPVIGTAPDVDGQEAPADGKTPPLAGQLASVNGKLAHVLALINATTAAVEL